jgi:hypothetical protein
MRQRKAFPVAWVRYRKETAVEKDTLHLPPPSNTVDREKGASEINQRSSNG